MNKYTSVYNSSKIIMVDKTNFSHIVRIKQINDINNVSNLICISIEDAESFVKDIQTNIQLCKERKLAKIITNVKASGDWREEINTPCK